MTTTAVIEQFKTAIERAGLIPPATIHDDGKLHRFPSNGERGDDAGWYTLFTDGIPAGAFGCWRTGIKTLWSAKAEHQMSGQERADHRARLEAIQREREQEQRRRQQEAAQGASALWENASPASHNHPYILAKHVKPYGLRLSEAGELMIPMHDDAGRLTSLQLIRTDGGKQFLPGGRVHGASYRIGDGEQTLLLAEGYATAASLHAATGFSVVVAFNAGNLLPVAHSLRRQYPSASILVCGDHDASGVGQTKAREAAEAISGRWVIPTEAGMDWNDVHVKRGADDVRLAIEGALKESRPMVTAASASLPDTNFTAMRVDDFMDVPPDQDSAEWVLEDYLPAGGLVLIAGKPKEGKTTLCYELAVKIAKGQPFLGRTTKAGAVLILGLEEHPRDMRKRLRDLGAEGAPLYVYSGAPLHPTPDTIERLKHFVAAENIRLVVVDTLSAFWTVCDENDAAAVQKAIQPILALAREGPCVLLIHHARKSEGSHGDEIRGSGALFAAVDVALILKRNEVQTQRKLHANSRYPETPSEMVLELRESGYVSLGDPAMLSRQAKRDKMKAALCAEPLDAKALAQRAGVPQRAAYDLLEELYGRHEAERNGEGRKGNPFLYWKNSFHATPLVLGVPPHETNYELTAFVSCAPRPPARITFLRCRAWRSLTMLVEAIDKAMCYRWPDGEVKLVPGKPVDLPEARALRLLQKAPGRVRMVQPDPPAVSAENNQPAERARIPPLKPGWLVVYRDRTGKLRGGTDERDHGTMKECRWNETGWRLVLTDGEPLSLTSIRAVGQTNEDGRLLAAWTVREHGFNGMDNKT